MSRRAVVTGGAGFIGSHLVRRLISDRWDVAVIDDLSSGTRANLERVADHILLVEGSVTEWTHDMDSAMSGASTIYHLAASVGNKRSIDDPRRDSEINMLGTIEVLEAARRHGVTNVVYSSSAGIFGQLIELPIPEGHPAEPDSPYGASKLGGEKVSLSYSRLYDMTVIALRYFNVYGPGQRYDAYGNVIPIWARHLSLGEPLPIFGDGQQTRDFVFVDDVVTANLAAGSAGRSGAFNIGSGRATDLRTLAGLMQEAAGRHVGTEYLPERPGDVRDSLADISKARDILQYEPSIQIEEGIERYIDWYWKQHMREGADPHPLDRCDRAN